MGNKFSVATLKIWQDLRCKQCDNRDKYGAKTPHILRKDNKISYKYLHFRINLLNFVYNLSLRRRFALKSYKSVRNYSGGFFILPFRQMYFAV